MAFEVDLDTAASGPAAVAELNRAAGGGAAAAGSPRLKALGDSRVQQLSSSGTLGSAGMPQVAAGGGVHSAPAPERRQ